LYPDRIQLVFSLYPAEKFFYSKYSLFLNEFSGNPSISTSLLEKFILKFGNRLEFPSFFFPKTHETHGKTK